MHGAFDKNKLIANVGMAYKWAKNQMKSFVQDILVWY